MQGKANHSSRPFAARVLLACEFNGMIVDALPDYPEACRRQLQLFSRKVAMTTDVVMS